MNYKVNKKVTLPTETVTNLFEYEDYRNFLNDFFAEQKRLKKIFSHRFFAQKAGFSSSSTVLKVIKGKTNLTEDSIKKIIKGIGFDAFSARYFKSLVKYNQAKDRAEKEKNFSVLDGLRKRTEYYQINKNQMAYFENWYYPVIREVVQYSDWNNDYKKLAQLIIPPITPEQAKEAVETLLKINILQRDKEGQISQTDTILTAVNIPPLYKKKQRREILEKGIEASENMSREERHISYTTIGVSEKTYEEIERYINLVRANILDMAARDGAADKVHQLVFELFPLSKRLKGVDP